MRHALRFAAALAGVSLAGPIAPPHDAHAAINSFGVRPYRGPMRAAPGNPPRCPIVRPPYGAACGRAQVGLQCAYVPTAPRAPRLRAVLTCSPSQPNGHPFWHVGAVRPPPRTDLRVIEGPLPPPEAPV